MEVTNWFRLDSLPPCESNSDDARLDLTRPSLAKQNRYIV